MKRPSTQGGTGSRPVPLKTDASLVQAGAIGLPALRAPVNFEMIAS